MASARRPGFVDRQRHLAAPANPSFAAGALLVPVLLLGLAVVVIDLRVLFYVHVATGAVWFEMVIMANLRL